MFNIKRLFFLFVLIVSSLFSLMNVGVVFGFLKEIPSGEDFGIFLLAWPLVLGWLIYASILIFLAFFSWKKIQEIDKLQLSKSGVSASQIEQKMLASFKMSPIVKFGVYFAIINFVMMFLVYFFEKN